MTQSIQNWFREVILDKVTIAMQAHGGLLDGTMVEGDVEANTVKFPVATGRSSVYKLTGAIEPVPVAGPALSTVQITMEDFEAAEWWRVQDAYKAGPSEQETLKNLVVKAIRRKRDMIKVDALTAYCNANAGGEISTIGNGTATIDILHVEQARAEIAGAGGDDGGEANVFAMFPAMWMTQLCFYKEFADAQWVGLPNAPFSMTQRLRMKTVRSVHYIEGPDEYFTTYDTGKLEAFMWHKESMGANTPWNQESPEMTKQSQLQGSPWLIKAGLGGAAIGIQEKGVKRFRMAKITAPVRPS